MNPHDELKLGNALRKAGQWIKSQKGIPIYNAKSKEWRFE